MSSQAEKLVDPMYAFDTFPERLSRLHLHGDLIVSGPLQRKIRSPRSGARYKTQPVTFDEIQEVDEETFGSPSADKADAVPDHLKDLLQPISRSMDGLLPRGARTDQPAQPHQGISRSRPGSRKSQRHPACILEGVDLEQQQSPPAQQQPPPQFPEGLTKSLEVSSQHEISASQDVSRTSETTEANTSGETLPVLPPSNIGQRRQKVTAKAKKRQQAKGTGEVV